MSSRSRRRNLHARAYATTQLAGIKCRGQRARVTVEQVTSSFPFLNPLTLNPLTLPFSFFSPPFVILLEKYSHSSHYQSRRTSNLPSDHDFRWSGKTGQQPRRSHLGVLHVRRHCTPRISFIYIYISKKKQ